MNFWSKISYLYMNSLEFFHFRWNGQQTKRNFIADTGNVLAVNTIQNTKINIKHLLKILTKWNCLNFNNECF